MFLIQDVDFQGNPDRKMLVLITDIFVVVSVYFI